MSFTELSPFKYTGNSHYPLNDQNFLVAVREDSIFSDRNIIPLYYITDDCQVLGIDNEEIGKNIYVVNSHKDTETEDIATRFAINELFKMFRGSFIINEKHELDPNRPKKRIFKNYLQEFHPNEIIEIFEIDLDIKKSRLYIKETALKEYINKRYVRTSHALFGLYNNETVGPFILNGSDDDGYFLAEISTLSKFGIYSFSQDDILEVEANKILRRIIYDQSCLVKAHIEDFDFISDRDLVVWFNSQLSSKNENIFNDRELDTLIKQIEKAINAKEIVESEERYKRLYEILSTSKEMLLSKQSLMRLVPQFQTIQNETESIQKNLFDLKNERERFTQSLDLLQSRVAEKEGNLRDLELKIQNLKNQEEEEQNKIRQKIQVEIAELEKRKFQIDAEIENERDIKSNHLKNLQADIEFKERRKNELDTGIETLKKEFTSEQKKAQEKLSELVKQNTHFNFISGRELPLSNEEENKFGDYTIKGERINDYKNLREGIINIFKSEQRHFEPHFIDNLLISLHQNTLTLFGGLPGTGKTSLAKIVTSSLAPKEKIKEIPVSRGWSSQKDLIGFPNPLTKKFHESQTGFYKILKQLNYEWETNSYLNSPMSYIILDEANLSPLEHYWSTFYNSTDSVACKTKPLSINLGQSEIIQHANSLRFIGTINYDQTTEELSPRILDRTNIIRIMPKQFQPETLQNNDIINLNVAYEDLIKIFHLQDLTNEITSIEMPDDLLTRYNQIKDIFNTKLNIYISPRVEIGIKRYCRIASALMTEHSRPLDYCVAQRLLPLINIQGNKKNELEILLKLIKNFNLDNSVSASILESIIEIGSRTGYTQDNYNYFLTLTNV